MAMGTSQRQVNIQVESALYQTLEAIAMAEKRSVPEAAKELVAEGVQYRISQDNSFKDLTSGEMVALAMAGGAFSWLRPAGAWGGRGADAG